MRLVALACAVAACASQQRAMEKCVDAGGSWFTSAPHPEMPGSCMMPTRDAGKTCNDSGECGSQLCECPGHPFSDMEGGPENGTQMTGTCAAFPARSGAGWMCVVNAGRVVRQGIIVD